MLTRAFESWRVPDRDETMMALPRRKLCSRAETCTPNLGLWRIMGRLQYESGLVVLLLLQLTVIVC